LGQPLLPSYDDALVQPLLLSYDALQPRRSPIKVVRSVTEPVSWISVALNAKTFHSFGKNIGACRNFIYFNFYAFLIKVNQYSDQNCQKTTGELIIWCSFAFFCL
jgi:hypothetical protein